MRFTVTTRRAVATLPLSSTAVQATFVRPTRKMLPDLGRQAVGSGPSVVSAALTVYLTRAPLADRVRAVFDVAPVICGGVVSKLTPGTVSVPVQRRTAEPVPGPRSLMS